VSSPARAGVVSLMTRAAYRPDFRGLASEQLRAAREKLRLSPEDFAGCVTDMVGWDVDPDLLTRWERGRGTPPVDVVLAARHLAGDEAPEPSGVLLATVPPAFPADDLAGYWVTCYDFTHAGRQQYHADVACITAETAQRVRITNHPPQPRTDGRAQPFRNEIEARLASRHLVGHWRNTSDSRYFGSLHLAVLPGETIMEGYYTGFASDIGVSAGQWKWARLDPASLPDAGPATVRLAEPSVLHGLVAERSPQDALLALAEIGEVS
jgi:hypothetical protein